MFSQQSASVLVTEESQIGEARRTSVYLAEQAGFDENQCGKVAIVATEAARNIVRHAVRGGEIVIQTVCSGTPDVRLDLFALDKGPGMGNVDACLRDGYSTAGTAGQGLGAIQRIADEFDVYSHPLSGVALFARFLAQDGSTKPRPGKTPDFQSGVISLPKTGETECGDSWSAIWGSPISRVIVADGLGHGPLAAEASNAAIRVFEQSGRRTAAATVESIHEALRATRGAAVSLVTLDTETKSIGFLGVGNVAGAVVTPPDTVKIMIGHNGTVGAQMHKLQEFPYTLGSDTVVILASDGLSSQWRFDRYPGLLNHHPAVIAGVLYRDANRGRDDVTVLVAKQADSSEYSPEYSSEHSLGNAA